MVKTKVAFPGSAESEMLHVRAPLVAVHKLDVAETSLNVAAAPLTATPSETADAETNCALLDAAGRSGMVGKHLARRHIGNVRRRCGRSAAATATAASYRQRGYSNEREARQGPRESAKSNAAMLVASHRYLAQG